MVRKKGAGTEPQETQGAPQTSGEGSGKGKTAGKAKKPIKRKAGPKKKAAGGRIRLYEKLNIRAMLDTVRGWASEGATIAEIAHILNVAESTVYKWQKEEPEFAESLRAGRHVSNGELIASAMRQSTGGTIPVKAAMKYKTYEWFTDPIDPKIRVLKQVEKVEVYDSALVIEPNAQMTMFMLANRMPDRYKKQHHVEHGGSVGTNYDHMTDEDLEAEILALEAMEEKPAKPQPPAH